MTSSSLPSTCEHCAGQQLILSLAKGGNQVLEVILGRKQRGSVMRHFRQVEQGTAKMKKQLFLLSGVEGRCIHEPSYYNLLGKTHGLLNFNIGLFKERDKEVS